MNCEGCGKTIPDDSRFCNYCGHGMGDILVEGFSVSSASTQTVPQPTDVNIDLSGSQPLSLYHGLAEQQVLCTLWHLYQQGDPGGTRKGFRMNPLPGMGAVTQQALDNLMRRGLVARDPTGVYYLTDFGVSCAATLNCDGVKRLKLE